MTDIPEDVMKAAEQTLDNLLCNEQVSCGGYQEMRNASIKEIASTIMAERERSQWQPIEAYGKETKFVSSRQILCGHSEKKWIRMGRWYPEVSKWYYSGTSERSQWAQVEGDAPTHFQPMPPFPEAS